VNKRFWNIAFRTIHIVTAGTLFGGHVFEIPTEQLLWWLYATILSGAALVLLEAYSNLSWCYQARGVSVLVKLLLLCSIPWLWDYRVQILIVVFVIASVSSHMPRRLRDFALLHREG